MNCPICGSKAQEGGLISESLFIGWVPLEEIQKHPIKEVLRFTFPNLHTISNHIPFFRRAKVPNAYFCEHCNKVFGIFDVTES